MPGFSFNLRFLTVITSAYSTMHNLSDIQNFSDVPGKPIVLFTTDNGAEIFSWPDGGNNPFCGEKGTTWEGGFRVPTCVR